MKIGHLIILSAVIFLLLYFQLNHLLFLWFACAIVTWLVALKFWRLYVIRQLSCEVKFLQSRLFMGEETEGEMIIENRGILPLYNVKLSFGLWDKMGFGSSFFTLISTQNHWSRYEGLFNVGKKQKIAIPFTIIGSHRGFYKIEEIRVNVTDPFGYDMITKSLHVRNELLVYPEEVKLRGLHHVQRMPQGEKVVRRWILDDPFFPAGSRPYQASDSFSRIDFKSTAKTQKLHTKIYDFTAHSDLCVVANILSNPSRLLGMNESHLERVLSIIAHLAKESVHKQLRFSLFINARMGKGFRAFELQAGGGKHHYRRVLEALARFTFFNITSFIQALVQVKQRYPNGTLLVVITPYVDDDITQELNLLARKGFEIYLLNPNQEVPSLVPWNEYIPTEVKEIG